MELSIIGVLVFILIGCLSKLFNYKKADELRESVAWCVATKDNVRCNLSLIDYIHKKQLHLNLPNEYRLILHASCSDKQFINDILYDYQNDLIQSYFAGYLTPLKSKYVLKGEPYFWISLQRYLCKKEDHLYEVCGKQLYYYDNNKKLLTEYGIAFYKLLYIAYLANKDIGYEPPFAMDNAKRYIQTKEL